MAAPALIGAVFYEDDRIVFRLVYPLPHEPDNVLDGGEWTERGIDPARKARLVKLPAGTAIGFGWRVAEADSGIVLTPPDPAA